MATSCTHNGITTSCRAHRLQELCLESVHQELSSTEAQTKFPEPCRQAAHTRRQEAPPIMFCFELRPAAHLPPSVEPTIQLSILGFLPPTEAQRSMETQGALKLLLLPTAHSRSDSPALWNFTPFKGNIWNRKIILRK